MKILLLSPLSLTSGMMMMMMGWKKRKEEEEEGMAPCWEDDADVIGWD